MKNTTPFAKQAANASLGAAAVGWLLPSVIRGYRENLAVDEAYLFLLAISGFSLLIMAIGVVLALMALYGIRQHEDYPLQLGMTRKEYGGSNAISIFRLSAPSVPVRHNIPSGGVRH